MVGIAHVGQREEPSQQIITPMTSYKQSCGRTRTTVLGYKHLQPEMQ